jgi:peptide/nickel transport system permease protein
LGLFVLTVWAAITLNFVLPRLMPGNPIQLAVAQLQGHVSPGIYAALQAEYGVKHGQGIIAQYFVYLGHTLQGNLGDSFHYYPEKVTTLIGDYLPWTLGLVGVCTVLSFVLGTAIGAMAAWKRGTWLDSTLVPIGVMLWAMPAFWIGLLMLYFLCYKFGWFPVAGAGVEPVTGFFSILWHAFLPGLTLTMTSMGSYVLLMRNTTITVLNDDFVKFARAEGLPNRVIAARYAARNAILPNFTSFALAIGFVVSGTVAIEAIFDYNGLGILLVEAVQNLDYPLIQGLFLIIVIGVLLAILISDLLYVFLDPRIRLESRS